MKTGKFITTAMLALSLVGIVFVGISCKKTTPTAAAADSVQLCLKCGQIKGSDLCCQPDQEKCSMCGLDKGSPGCCAIPEGAAQAAICTHCGQIKGSELCCKPGQEKCSMCGLVKGSPGCCKLPMN